jgi:DNA-binding HxlR family transcriptional regulator
VRVEYSLTELGGTLAEPLAAVRAWAESHIEQVLEAQDRFDTESESASDGVAPIGR